jgi:hypothetical protein
MNQGLDLEYVQVALKEVAEKAIHGTRQERSGRFETTQQPRASRTRGERIRDKRVDRGTCANPRAVKCVDRNSRLSWCRGLRVRQAASRAPRLCPFDACSVPFAHFGGYRMRDAMFEKAIKKN